MKGGKRWRHGFMQRGLRNGGLCLKCFPARGLPRADPEIGMAAEAAYQVQRDFLSQLNE